MAVVDFKEELFHGDSILVSCSLQSSEEGDRNLTLLASYSYNGSRESCRLDLPLRFESPVRVSSKFVWIVGKKFLFLRLENITAKSALGLTNIHVSSSTADMEFTAIQDSKRMISLNCAGSHSLGFECKARRGLSWKSSSVCLRLDCSYESSCWFPLSIEIPLNVSLRRVSTFEDEPWVVSMRLKPGFSSRVVVGSLVEITFEVTSRSERTESVFYEIRHDSSSWLCVGVIKGRVRFEKTSLTPHAVVAVKAIPIRAGSLVVPDIDLQTHEAELQVSRTYFSNQVSVIPSGVSSTVIKKVTA